MNPASAERICPRVRHSPALAAAVRASTVRTPTARSLLLVTWHYLGTADEFIRTTDLLSYTELRHLLHEWEHIPGFLEAWQPGGCPGSSGQAGRKYGWVRGYPELEEAAEVAMHTNVQLGRQLRGGTSCDEDRREDAAAAKRVCGEAPLGQQQSDLMDHG